MTTMERARDLVLAYILAAMLFGGLALAAVLERLYARFQGPA